MISFLLADRIPPALLLVDGSGDANAYHYQLSRDHMNTHSCESHATITAFLIGTEEKE